MGLPTTSQDFPFTGGASKKLDAALVQGNKLLDVVNYTYNKNGTLQRRDGMQRLTTNAHNCIEVAAYYNQLLKIAGVLGTDQDLYSYSPQVGWLDAGTPPYIYSTSQSISSGANPTDQSASIGQPDCATTSGMTCFIWIGYYLAANTVFVSVVDDTTGAFIINTSLAYVGGNIVAARVAAAGGSFFILAANTSGNVFCNVLAAGATSVPNSPGTPLTDFSTTSDNATMDVVGFGSNVAVLYSCQTAGTSAKLVLLDSSGNVVASSAQTVTTDIVVPKANLGGVTLSALSSTVLATFVGRIDDTFVASQPWTWSGSSWSGPGTTLVSVGVAPYYIGSCAISSTLAQCVASYGATISAVEKVVAFTFTSTSTPSGITTLASQTDLSNLQGPFVAGKPFVSNGLVFFPVAMYSGAQGQGELVLLDVSGNVVARALQNKFSIFTSGSFPTNAGQMSHMTYQNMCAPTTTILGNGQACVPAAVYGLQLELVLGQNATAVTLSRALFSLGRAAGKLCHSMAGPSLFFSGSNPKVYDGATISDAGFIYTPESVAVSNSGSGTGPTNGASYQAVFVYEWYDNQGQRWQSAPSIPATLTSNGQSIQMSCPPLMLGTRLATSSLVAYRTIGNGTTFYRDGQVGSTAAGAPAYPNGNIPNNPTVAVISVYSQTTDANLQTFEPLYSEPDATGGTTLASLIPPCFNVCCEWQTRLAYVPADYPYEVRVSQLPIPGVGLQFSPALTLGFIPTDFGPITALGVLDDQLVVYTAQRTFRVYGTGPDATGANSAYSTYQLLPRGAGCIEPRSILNLPTGQAHQTNQGLYLLDRAFTDNYLSSEQEPNILGQTITSAVLCSDKAQARWTVPGLNLCVVFDYLMGQWSVFSGTGYSGNPMSFDSACLYGNVFAAIDNANTDIVQDVPGVYFDGGATLITKQPINGSFQTPWFKLSSLQGFDSLRRVVLFGPFGNPTSLTFAEAKDFDGGTTYGPLLINVTNTPVSAGGMVTSDGLRWQFRQKVAQQKGESFSFFVTDSPATSGENSGQGLGFTGITLEWAVKKGANKLQAGQSF